MMKTYKLTDGTTLTAAFVGEAYSDDKARECLGNLFRVGPVSAPSYVICPLNPRGGLNAPGEKQYSAVDFIALPSLRLSSTREVKRYQLRG